MIEERYGDLLMETERPLYIAHVVNTVGAWGAGFTGPLGAIYPIARRDYFLWHWTNPPLGTVLPSAAAPDVMVLHMRAQVGLPSRTNPRPCSLSALETCIRAALAHVPEGRVLCMPRIGCGYGGHVWADVRPVIERAAEDRTVRVYSFEASSC